MRNNNCSNSKNKSGKLIFLCWLVYACSYIGKLSYNANISTIGVEYNVTYSQAGIVSTFFFFAYGAGQIINGLLCKRYNLKYVVFFSLFVACVMNVLVVVTTNFSLLKFFWLVNGVSLSFLWTSLVRLLSETINKSEMSKAIIVMGTTVAIGTFIVYGISALFVAVLSFKWTFYFAAAIMCVVAFSWLFSFDLLVVSLKKERLDEEQQEGHLFNEKKTVFTPKSSSRNMLFVYLPLMAVFAVANNLIKDGITVWTPDILVNLYNTPDWLSILLTLLLPMLAICGTMVANLLYKFNNNYIIICSILFGVSAVLIGVVLLLLTSNLLVLTLFCFGMVSCLMAGANSTITSIAPLRMNKYMNSGKMAGILNGFCYLGSTISSYGLGYIADLWGWESVFMVLLIVCTTVTAVGIIYVITSKIILNNKKATS